MQHEEIKSLFEELKKLLDNMDIPSFRRTSINWLAKNMAARNSQHENFQRANEIVTKLKRAGIAKEPE